ncbi:MAG: hypothetical protein AB1453_03290 [Chloroflexota bacterium]|jgi:hypothetical protein
MERKAYPSDGSDEECAFVDPYPALMLELTEQSVELAYVDQGFALLPRRWVAERSFGWAVRFRCPNNAFIQEYAVETTELGKFRRCREMLQVRI